MSEIGIADFFIKTRGKIGQLKFNIKSGIIQPSGIFNSIGDPLVSSKFYFSFPGCAHTPREYLLASNIALSAISYNSVPWPPTFQRMCLLLACAMI